jgi:GH15 family glucan-1,4-alpha-glucosidase
MCHKDDPGEIGHPLYGLHYPSEMVEEELEHFTGYRHSKPVRVGNAAGDQEQLDTYGELITAIYTATDYGEEVFEGEWEVIEEVIEHVSGIWMNEDSGIWEVRSEPTHVVHSKALCWAALDRGIEIAEDNEFDAPIERWKDDRDAIRESLLEEGFDEELGCFTQTYEGETVDAAALRLGSVGFLPFDDGRMQGTIDAVMEHLMTDDGLVMRYEGDDGLPGEEGAFVLCSFWLVECLALSGRVEEARDVFENVMEHISPLGLFAEELDPDTGEHRGNFPQAFSHIGLINAVLYLNEAEEGEAVDPVDR